MDSKLIYLESLDGGLSYGVGRYRGEKVGAGASDWGPFQQTKIIGTLFWWGSRLES